MSVVSVVVEASSTTTNRGDSAMFVQIQVGLFTVLHLRTRATLSPLHLFDLLSLLRVLPPNPFPATAQQTPAVPRTSWTSKEVCISCITCITCISCISCITCIVCSTCVGCIAACACAEKGGCARDGSPCRISLVRMHFLTAPRCAPREILR